MGRKKRKLSGVGGQRAEHHRNKTCTKTQTEKQRLKNPFYKSYEFKSRGKRGGDKNLTTWDKNGTLD